MQVQGKKTYAGTANSTVYHHFTGKECLDVHLLKPARLDVPPGQSNVYPFNMAGHSFWERTVR